MYIASQSRHLITLHVIDSQTVVAFHYITLRTLALSFYSLHFTILCYTIPQHIGGLCTLYKAPTSLILYNLLIIVIFNQSVEIRDNTRSANMIIQMKKGIIMIKKRLLYVTLSQSQYLYRPNVLGRHRADRFSICSRCLNRCRANIQCNIGLMLVRYAMLSGLVPLMTGNVIQLVNLINDDPCSVLVL